MSVRKQESKNIKLRQFLVSYVERVYAGRPILGWEISDVCKVRLAEQGVLTTSEVLAKELRHAARKQELDRSHRIVDGRKFVEYSPAGCAPGGCPPAKRASPGASQKTDSSGQGLLLDADDLTAPHHKRG